MRDWGKVKRINRTGNCLILLNILLAAVLIFAPSLKAGSRSRPAVIHAKRGVKLRTGPDINSPSVATIPTGAEINILSESTDISNSWVKVGYEGQEGWVWGAYIEVK